MNFREIAFIALWKALKEQEFISDTLALWKNREGIAIPDFNRAKEIAYGSMQRKLSLEYLALLSTNHNKLNFKLKEKALLYTAIYQLFFTKEAPHAIVNETIIIAKKHFHLRYSKFLNAILRKFISLNSSLPTGSTEQELSIQYSFPLELIRTLIKDYGFTTTLQVLSVSNEPGSNYVRLRKEAFLEGLELVEFPPKVAKIINSSLVSELALSPNFYIQNITPILLFIHLHQLSTIHPQHILDLCASPGGKTLLLYDTFPSAKVTANDVSVEKMEKLFQNISKYDLKIKTSCFKGEAYPKDQKFDLILIDAPCSNTGVLHKRPEARWRFCEEHLNTIVLLQKQLIQNALELLSPEGEIWYMTCSVVKEENENLINKLTSVLPLKLVTFRTIFPDQEGKDGGFAALLKKFS